MAGKIIPLKFDLLEGFLNVVLEQALDDLEIRKIAKTQLIGETEDALRELETIREEYKAKIKKLKGEALDDYIDTLEFTIKSLEDAITLLEDRYNDNGNNNS